MQLQLQPTPHDAGDEEDTTPLASVVTFLIETRAMTAPPPTLPRAPVLQPSTTVEPSSDTAIDEPQKSCVDPIGARKYVSWYMIGVHGALEDAKGRM